MELTIPSGLFSNDKNQGIRRWKNVGIMKQVLQAVKDKNLISAGSVIDTQKIAQLVRENKLDKHWKLNPDAKDGNGLPRTVGDTIGGHGLGLRKIADRQYVMPKVLPETDGDVVLKEAVY